MKIAYGTTRYVILTKRWAIKLPAWDNWRMFLQGLLGNMSERQFESCLSGYVVPIKLYVPGGFCNITPRCDVKSYEDEDRMDYVDRYFEMVERMFERDGSCSVGEILLNMVERKIDSVGMLNGKLYAVDYGH